MLHTSGHFLKRFSAPLAGIHRRFIDYRYLRECPATAIRVPCMLRSQRPSGSFCDPQVPTSLLTS
jgi:hypothetical protein